MATKLTYKNEVGRKWDVGSGTATENIPFSEPSLGCYVERFLPVAMPGTNFLNKNTREWRSV
jgi:hypothetical protein